MKIHSLAAHVSSHKIKKCEICDKNITIANYKKHLNAHKKKVLTLCDIIQYDSNKKIKGKNVIKKDKDKINLIIVGVFTVLILGGIIFGFLNYIQYDDAIKENAKLRIENKTLANKLSLKNTQLRHLISSMNNLSKKYEECVETNEQSTNLLKELKKSLLIEDYVEEPLDKEEKMW